MRKRVTRAATKRRTKKTATAAKAKRAKPSIQRMRGKPSRRLQASAKRSNQPASKPPRRKRSAAHRNTRRVKRAERAKPKTAAKRAAPSLEGQLRRLKGTRTQLEKRLTAAVQEIGVLRQFEARVSVLESQLVRKTIELEDLRRASEERIRMLEARLGSEDETRQSSLPLPPG